MKVINRNNIPEEVSFDKILTRIQRKSQYLNIDHVKVAQKVVSQMFDGITTKDLDELTCQICASLSTENLDYGVLASRIIINNNHKNTPNSFSDCIELLDKNKDTNGEPNPLVSKKLYEVVLKNKTLLDNTVCKDRDNLFDYFGFKTLEKSYLFRVNGNVVERIGYLLMRVSLGLYLDNLELAIQSYHFMSQKFFIHGTPTLFNSGTDNPQLLSCYLLGIHDSVQGIYKNISDCAMISKMSGGIGVHISNIRSKESLIRTTNGKSNGIIPMLRVLNETGKYINQGGKRNGSIAIYLEPHHPEILGFLDIKKNHGNEDLRARDLFPAMWVSDLFMETVKEDGDWYLFDPDECPGLNECYGENYKVLYQKYRVENKFREKVAARKIWKAIIDSQIETGTPYILFKDHINKKSNQKNLGVIKSSNLCAEIVEYSDEKEYACCTLGSIGLPMCVENGKFNFQQLEKVVGMVTRNLNRIIDINNYPIDETARSNYRHRPLGIGVQGLADVFAILKIPFESVEAKKLNIDIFETIYYASLKTSNLIAKEYLVEKNKFYQELRKTMDELELSDLELDEFISYVDRHYPNKYGTLVDFYHNNPSLKYEDSESGSYSSFKGSPLSLGKFQFDLAEVTVSDGRHDFTQLRQNIRTSGIRNSLCVALMPTASTSQILGNNECFEPFTSNIYSRRTLAGDFVVVNKYLVNDLSDLKLWSTQIKNTIIQRNGSIQSIDEIPDNIKRLYKTAWEMSQKSIIQLAIDRSPFICQTQSMNLFFQSPNMKNISSALFYGWTHGLKTGCYYIRNQPPVQAQQFTIEKEVNKTKPSECSILNREGCEACSA